MSSSPLAAYDFDEFHREHLPALMAAGNGDDDITT